MGFNVEHITFQQTKFAIWDLNGRWDAVGVVYVVDSSEEDFMEEAKIALWRLFEKAEELKDAVLLVFADRQDRLNGLTVIEVKSRMGLQTRAQGQRWHVQGCVTTTSEGLVEGMEWMAAQLSNTR